MFSSGPRLAGDPKGDARRQAVASLRGYAYQLYASALAWLRLGSDESLFLEVAEDYATASSHALNAVQVKDIAGTVTIRSESVRDTIDAFVDLTRNNPTRALRLRYLSTGTIGIERSKSDRAAGVATLTYWRRAAAGADVTPLRAVLQSLDLKDDTKRFIAERDDTALRAEFLTRIHWDCGAADLDGLKRELDAALLEISHQRSLALTVPDVRQVGAALLEHVLEAATRSDNRVLTALDRQATIESVTHTLVPKRQLEALLAASLGGASAGFQRPTGARSLNETKLPLLLASRPTQTAPLIETVLSIGLVFIIGATGMGKTLLARLAADKVGGEWLIADFYGLDPDQTVERMDRVLGDSALNLSKGLILDDLNECEDPRVLKRLADLRLALERHDKLCLVTSYRAPSARVRSELNIPPNAISRAQDLDQTDVGDLVSAAGGSPSHWARAIWLGAACGHPQLVQAVIANLQWRSWPTEELQRLQSLDTSGVEVAAERTAARRRLMEAAPDPAKTLLYRLSLLIGVFDRPLALAIGDLPEIISTPGAYLDTLVGPWIDHVGDDRYRTSALLSDAGSQVLSASEQDEVHRRAARHHLCDTTLNVEFADAGFIHALKSNEETALSRLAMSVIRSSHENIGKLSSWLNGLRLIRTDKEVFPKNPTISRMLRLAQVLLDAGAEQHPRLREKWAALQREISGEPDEHIRESFEHLALAKLLLSPAAAELPDWVGLLLRFNSLAAKDPARSKTLSDADAGHPGGVIGFYFLHLALAVGSVERLEEIFHCLNTIDAVQREVLLGRVKSEAGNAAHIVNGAWLADHQKGELAHLAAADAYRRMAKLSSGWGEIEIAVRCEVARSIMLDEYADDEASALAVLSEASSDLGPHVAISRARAKIAYRRRQHDLALALMREVTAESWSDDPVERAFLFREAAISSSELGQMAEARDWFRLAHEAAQSAQGPTLKPFAVGLGADLALAEWRCGRAEAALEILSKAVVQSGDLEDTEALKVVYCRKAIGHACLWLHEQITAERYTIQGEPVAAPAGFCSNPDPPESIRDLPPASIEGSLYLLAIAEIRLGGSVGVDQLLDQVLKGQVIHLLEVLRRKSRLERAIEVLDWDLIRKSIGPATEWGVDAVRRFPMQRSQNAQSFILERGGVTFEPRELASDLSARALVNDAVFAVQLISEMREESDAEHRLRALERSIVDDGYPEPDFRENASARPHTTIGFWRAAQATDCSIDDLFIACLRILEWARSSHLGGLMLPHLGAWASKRWGAMLDPQRFRLRNPEVNSPNILAACSSGETGDLLASILRAAEPAFRFSLDAGLRQLFLSPQPLDLRGLAIARPPK